VLIDANKTDPDLRVVCADASILRIFEVAGLSRWLHVSPSLPAALADEHREQQPGSSASAS
jgi:hypothetical protein